MAGSGSKRPTAAAFVTTFGVRIRASDDEWNLGSPAENYAVPDAYTSDNEDGLASANRDAQRVCVCITIKVNLSFNQLKEFKQHS